MVIFSGMAWAQGESLFITDNGDVIVPGDIKPSKAHIGSYLVPKGAIIMWSGDQSDIPQGWTLCDGANGTPDLRARFAVGVLDPSTSTQFYRSRPDLSPPARPRTPTISPGSTGGRRAIPTDTPGLANHIHELSFLITLDIKSPWSTPEVPTTLPDGQIVQSTEPKLGTAGDYHDLTIVPPLASRNDNARKPINIMPPYYAIYFIMKL